MDAILSAGWQGPGDGSGFLGVVGFHLKQDGVLQLLALAGDERPLRRTSLQKGLMDGAGMS